MAGNGIAISERNGIIVNENQIKAICFDYLVSKDNGNQLTCESQDDLIGFVSYLLTKIKGE
ncbi:MAG: hypothetical protein IJV29_06430 [Butyrivibrio sp.]|nr:hypothetical protein [Butyrivibrio sp.]